MAADDAAATPVVLHCREHQPAGVTPRIARRNDRASMEDRAVLAHLVSGWAHVRFKARVGAAGEQARNPGQPVRRDPRRASAGRGTMSERLSIVQIGVLCSYAAGMAGGQVLFKL